MREGWTNQNELEDSVGSQTLHPQLQAPQYHPQIQQQQRATEDPTTDATTPGVTTVTQTVTQTTGTEEQSSQVPSRASRP